MKPLEVLIVDDSVIVRNRTIRHLSGIPNVEVTGAVGSVVEALSAFNHAHPDVVVLDIDLIDGRGFDVLDAIRRGHDSTTVVMFTNHPTLEFRARSLQSGADLFLEKAHGFTVLSDFLRWLARRRDRMPDARTS